MLQRNHFATFLALGMVLVGCMTSGAQLNAADEWPRADGSTVGYRFGDPGTGLVLSIGLGSADGHAEGVGAGGIQVTTRTTERAQANPSEYFFQWKDGKIIPPQRYLSHLQIELDGVSFAHVDLDPRVVVVQDSSYLITFPYAPKVVAVKARLSTGEQFQKKIRVAKTAPINRTYDARKQPYSDILLPYSGRNDAPTKLHNQAVMRAMPIHGSSAGVRSVCSSSREKGPIQEARLFMKQHPLFAPKGDVSLQTTRFDQPIFNTYIIHRINIDRPHSWLSAEQVEFLFECKTVKGDVFKSAATVMLPERRPPEGG